MNATNWFQGKFCRAAIDPRTLLVAWILLYMELVHDFKVSPLIVFRDQRRSFETSRLPVVGRRACRPLGTLSLFSFVLHGDPNFTRLPATNRHFGDSGTRHQNQSVKRNTITNNIISFGVGVYSIDREILLPHQLRITDKTEVVCLRLTSINI